MHQYIKSARPEAEGMLKHVFEAFNQARLKIIYSATNTEDSIIDLCYNKTAKT